MVPADLGEVGTRLQYDGEDCQGGVQRWRALPIRVLQDPKLTCSLFLIHSNWGETVTRAN
jgi:hypothetical protein